jgi:hypothetical protein
VYPRNSLSGFADGALLHNKAMHQQISCIVAIDSPSFFLLSVVIITVRIGFSH